MNCKFTSFPSSRSDTYVALLTRLSSRRYQAGTRLIVSAAAEPMQIFNFEAPSTAGQKTTSNAIPTIRTGEEERFAKDRTVSRLIEMQSEEYLRSAQEKSEGKI